EGGGDALQLFADIFAKLLECASAIGAARLFRMVRHYLARKVLGQRPAEWLGLRRGLCARRLSDGCIASLRRFQLFKLELKLFQLSCDLLALGAEQPAAQLVDDQFHI